MTEQFHNSLTILRRKQVEIKTGLARSTIYAHIVEGKFPKPIDLGGAERLAGLNLK